MIIIIVNQIEIHPFLAWDECVSFCEKENIAIMAYSPLAKAEKMQDHALCKLARRYDYRPIHDEFLFCVIDTLGPQHRL